MVWNEKLIETAKNGDLKKAKECLANGANVNFIDKHNNSALYYAKTNEIWDHLKPKASNINSDLAFINCAMRSNLKQVKHFLSLSKGANINTKNKSGKTALMIACQNGNFEIAIALIKNGTDLNIKDSKGKMALNYIVDNNRNKDSETFLIWACKNGNLEMVKLLISKGSNLNARDKDDNTALISASSSGHLEVVKCLIENGLNIEDKNKYGYTALKIASLEGNFEIVKYLISTDTNARGIYDETTALMEASSSGHLGIVKFLVNNGTDINAKTNGKPVLDFAENDTIREFLKSKGAK